MNPTLTLRDSINTSLDAMEQRLRELEYKNRCLTIANDAMREGIQMIAVIAAEPNDYALDSIRRVCADLTVIP